MDCLFFFFFNDTATTEIYTLSLHDALPISRQLKMARRTVKAHFNRLFLRFGISGGIKRVKLATLLYRRQLCSEASATENAFPASESSVSSNSSLRDSKTGKSQMKSAPQSTSSKTIFESSTTSSDSGIGLNSPSGMKRVSMEPRPTPDRLESWEHRILDLDQTDISGFIE